MVAILFCFKDLVESSWSHSWSWSVGLGSAVLSQLLLVFLLLKQQTLIPQSLWTPLPDLTHTHTHTVTHYTHQ